MNGNHNYLVTAQSDCNPLDEQTGEKVNDSNEIFGPRKDRMIRQSKIVQASTENEVQNESYIGNIEKEKKNQFEMEMGAE